MARHLWSGCRLSPSSHRSLFRSSPNGNSHGATSRPRRVGDRPHGAIVGTGHPHAITMVADATAASATADHAVPTDSSTRSRLRPVPGERDAPFGWQPPSPPGCPRQPNSAGCPPAPAARVRDSCLLARAALIYKLICQLPTVFSQAKFNSSNLIRS